MLLTRLRDVICEREEVLRRECHGPTITIVMDHRCNVLHVSGERAELLGYDAEDVTTITAYTHCHPEDRWTLMLTITALFAKNVQGRCDFRVQHCNGRWIPMRVYVEPLIEDGQVSGYIGAYHERVDLQRWDERKRLQMLIEQKMRKTKTNRLV